MAAAETTPRPAASGFWPLAVLFELGIVAGICIGAGLLSGVLLHRGQAVPALPMITAVTLVLVPGLISHILIRAAQRNPAQVSLLALAGTAIRLVVTLGGAVAVALSAPWGQEMAFWIPLAASYLAVLATELLFSLRTRSTH